MTLPSAFLPSTSISLTRPLSSTRNLTSFKPRFPLTTKTTKASAQDTVEKYFPPQRRGKAPFISLIPPTRTSPKTNGPSRSNSSSSSTALAVTSSSIQQIPQQQQQPNFPMLKLEMKPVETFTNTDPDIEQDTLFDYDDSLFGEVKREQVGTSWPSGDGRRRGVEGTVGSFSQPNLRIYGPFKDFYKRSCDL